MDIHFKCYVSTETLVSALKNDFNEKNLYTDHQEAIVNNMGESGRSCALRALRDVREDRG